MSAHHITIWDVPGGELLVQEVEPAETKLDVDLGTAQTMKQASRTWSSISPLPRQDFG